MRCQEECREGSRAVLQEGPVGLTLGLDLDLARQSKKLTKLSLLLLLVYDTSCPQIIRSLLLLGRA